MEIQQSHILTFGALVLVLFAVHCYKTTKSPFAYQQPVSIPSQPSPFHFVAPTEQDGPLGADQLIGMVYPPKAGPLYTNFSVPPSNNCGSPYALITTTGAQMMNGCLPNV